MAEMIRERESSPNTTSLYPEIKPLTPQQIKENNDFLNQFHPGAGLLADVTKNAVKPPVQVLKPPVENEKPVEKPTEKPPLPVKNKYPLPPKSEEISEPKIEQKIEPKIEPKIEQKIEETTDEFDGIGFEEPAPKTVEKPVHWKDQTVSNMVPMSKSETQLRKPAVTTRHSEAHERPIVENCQSEDDFAGFTADPVLNVICRGQKFSLKRFQQKGNSKLEVRVDNQPAILLSGSEKDQMLNGFSLKVLTLGIVKTRFAFSLNDTQGAKVFEASRGVGTSRDVDINLTYFKDAIKCGKIQPTGFKINRITYHVYDDAKRHIFSLQGGMLRGLFSDGWDLVLPDKTKIGTYDKGELQFKEQGVPGTAKFITMKQKILAIAACQIIQLHK